MPQLLAAPDDSGGLLALPFMYDEPGLGVSRGGTACVIGLNDMNATPGNVAKAMVVAILDGAAEGTAWGASLLVKYRRLSIAGQAPEWRHSSRAMPPVLRSGSHRGLRRRPYTARWNNATAVWSPSTTSANRRSGDDTRKRTAAFYALPPRPEAAAHPALAPG